MFPSINASSQGRPRSFSGPVLRAAQTGAFPLDAHTLLGGRRDLDDARREGGEEGRKKGGKKERTRKKERKNEGKKE